MSMPPITIGISFANVGISVTLTDNSNIGIAGGIACKLGDTHKFSSEAMATCYTWNGKWVTGTKAIPPIDFITETLKDPFVNGKIEYKLQLESHMKLQRNSGDRDWMRGEQNATLDAPELQAGFYRIVN